jgi:hypothetical protein
MELQMSKDRPMSNSSKFKRFSNVDQVFGAMLGFGFFADAQECEEAKAKLSSKYETYYSSGKQAVKIFNNNDGTYDLCNFAVADENVAATLFSIAK